MTEFYEAMHKEFIKAQLCDDFIFKKVMSNQKLLKGFLEKVVCRKINKLIEITPGRELFEFKDSHKIICDIYAKDDMGRVYIVECQNYTIKGFIHRLEYYAQISSVEAFRRSSHPNKRNQYKSFPEVYCIWICHKNPFRDKNGMVNCTKIALESNISMYHQQRQIILSRDCMETIEDKDIRDFLRLVWKTTLKNSLHSSWDVVHLAYKEYERIKHCKESEEEYMLNYDDQVYYEIKGERKGKREGKKEAKIETIMNMHLEGLDLNLIAKVTKCSINEIKEIIDTMATA